MSKHIPCEIQGCNKAKYSKGLCVAHSERKRRHGHPLAGGTSKGALMQWIKSNVNYTQKKCLVWPFGKFTNGYGMIFINGHSTNAHRVMCRLAHGEPPTPTHQAAHNCGKGHRGCINPTHLRWATVIENHADKLRHKTHNRGERHPQAKLTKANVNAIRSLRGQVSGRTLANRYRVSTSLVSMIQTSKIWKHL